MSGVGAATVWSPPRLALYEDVGSRCYRLISARFVPWCFSSSRKTGTDSSPYLSVRRQHRQSSGRNPSWRKRSSLVRTSVMPRACMKVMETQSVRLYPLSG